MQLVTPGLSVLIINYNSGTYACDCIDSLLKQENVALEIIVVDNASQDNSLAMLQEMFGDRIVLIVSKENLGFGRANNLAAKTASKEFVLVLNPDTHLADTHALSKLLAYLQQYPKFGMVGPAILEPRKNKQVLPRLRYPSARSLKHTPQLQNLPGKIAWLLGACMLMRRSVYEELHGFDPDYFLYGEDADICLRLRQNGYEIGYCAEVSITHVSGASEIGADSFDKWLRKKRGVFLFFQKHFDVRDTRKIAKNAIAKASMYLAILKLTHIFSFRNAQHASDKINRLKATKVAAAEVLMQIKSSS
ncbi:MAG TPA: glycosyltransferase family 2 protein [Methylophilaceae bacterium]|nr:glycosyltransferase family 2 protein [Methylophilaceae bacterium]